MSKDPEQSNSCYIWMGIVKQNKWAVHEKNANIHLLCLDIPFGNRTYKSDNLTIQVLDSDLEKIKA